MGRVCVGRLCYGPSLQWAEFAMGRDVQLPAEIINNNNNNGGTTIYQNYQNYQEIPERL